MANLLRNTTTGTRWDSLTSIESEAESEAEAMLRETLA